MGNNKLGKWRRGGEGKVEKESGEGRVVEGKEWRRKSGGGEGRVEEEEWRGKSGGGRVKEEE